MQRMLPMYHGVDMADDGVDPLEELLRNSPAFRTGLGSSSAGLAPMMPSSGGMPPHGPPGVSAAHAAVFGRTTMSMASGMGSGPQTASGHLYPSTATVNAAAAATGTYTATNPSMHGYGGNQGYSPLVPSSHGFPAAGPNKGSLAALAKVPHGGPTHPVQVGQRSLPASIVAKTKMWRLRASARKARGSPHAFPSPGSSGRMSSAFKREWQGVNSRNTGGMQSRRDGERRGPVPDRLDVPHHDWATEGAPSHRRVVLQPLPGTSSVTSARGSDCGSLASDFGGSGSRFSMSGGPELEEGVDAEALDVIPFTEFVTPAFVPGLPLFPEGDEFLGLTVGASAVDPCNPHTHDSARSRSRSPHRHVPPVMGAAGSYGGKQPASLPAVKRGTRLAALSARGRGKEKLDAGTGSPRSRARRTRRASRGRTSNVRARASVSRRGAQRQAAAAAPLPELYAQGYLAVLDGTAQEPAERKEPQELSEEYVARQWRPLLRLVRVHLGYVPVSR